MADRYRPCRRDRPTVRVTGQRGFTLLEVLVALTIVAVALGAVIRTSGQSTGNLVYIRDKIVAGWVAENRIAEAMLAEQWPATGTSEGMEEMVGQEWAWEVTVTATADSDLRRLDVRVRPEGTEQGSLVTVSAFRGKGRQP